MHTGMGDAHDTTHTYMVGVLDNSKESTDDIEHSESPCMYVFKVNHHVNRARQLASLRNDVPVHDI